MTGGSALSAAGGMKRASSGASGRARRVGNRVQRSTDASSSRVRSETDAYGTECARGVGGTGRTIAVVQIRRAARALLPTLVRRDARGGVHASALARFAFVVRVDRSLVVSARYVLAFPRRSAHPTHQNVETGTPHSGRERGGDEFNSSSDGLISSTRRIESSSANSDRKTVTTENVVCSFC